VARVLLLFVDGVGLAPVAETNPLAAGTMPALDAELGGPLTVERVGRGSDWTLAALDATLGVPGAPQSATGQTTLFTGTNAPARLGRHVPAFPGARLKAILEERSILRRAREAGRAATFANPFSPRYFAEIETRRRRHSATTLAAMAGGGELRGLAELAAGEACTWDVTRADFRCYEPAVAPISATEAGRQLARLAGRHDLTLWETFMTDLAGHGRRGWTAAEALARLDGLIAGVLAARPADLTVLLTSDHGNLEDASQRLHTRNPVPLLAIGFERDRFAGLSALDQVAPAILSTLGIGDPELVPAANNLR